MSNKLRHGVCFVMFRGILPLLLLAAAVVRFNGFSLLYLLLVLAEPLLPSPTPASVSGKTGSYLIASVVLCSCTLTAQIVFQSYSLVIATPDEPYGSWLKNCTLLESSLRQLGLQRLEPNDYENILRIMLPDIAAFIITLTVFIICKKLLPSVPQHSRQHLQRQQSVLRRRLESYGTYFLNVLGNFLVALFLAGSGIANPCVLSSVYFLTFLALATWWGCYKPLGHKFAVLRILLLLYTGANLILLYLYQFQFFQQLLSPDTLIARVVGLTALVLTKCRKPWLMEVNQEAEWWMFINPAVLLLLYFTLACEIRRWSTRIKEVTYASGRVPSSHAVPGTGGMKVRRQRANSATSEHQVLDAAANEALVEDTAQTYNSTDNVDSMSVTPQSDIYNIDTDTSHLADNASQTEKIRSPLASVFVYVMKQSYVSTLILMMVWSITYHSWLTFVFLLAACIIWMIPHKRNICLCVSPIVVCYAEGLLLIQYIYGFNLTTDELPTKTASGFRYSQIGLMKLPNPCIHIGLQVLFTVFFMLTLRQYMRELHIKRQEYYMQGLLLRPVDNEQARAVGTETSLIPISMGDVIDGQDSDTMISFGNWLWHMLCKYWILMCAILLLVISIQEAVIYRIIYLGFFLYFVITFQVCHRFWRFSVYVFWWIVIVYSMVVLLCIYTYQFDNFPQYWMNGTGLSADTLSDLGLETFSTAMLFAKLLTPTVFVIIICIQVHYFQKPFLKLSDVRRFRLEESSITNDIRGERGEEDSVTDGNLYCRPRHDSQETRSVTGVQTHMSRKQRFWLWLKKCTLNVYGLLDRCSVLAWRIVEIHIHKFVMFTIFITCVSEICAINVILVIFVTVFLPAPVLYLLMSHLCQCYTGIILLAKMIYQLKLVPHEYALSNCTTVHNLNDSNLPYPFNETIDSAAYVGLELTDNLPYYLKNYVLIVVILGFEAIVHVHQAQYYNKPGVERPPDSIVFLSIKRSNADDGLISCFKYFVNYGFYKFGLQICFIMTMVTMVVRLDAYSVLYGLFLAVLLCLSRRSCYRIWPAYIVVLIVLLILQYLSCCGVPEALCWGYPWDTLPAITRNLKIYLYLPNYVDSPNAYLLIADFFQLLFVCLQWGVFRIENQENADSYPGGSNMCILEIVEENGPIPVADFLYCKASYLDYIKSAVFQYSFWVTLVFVFIAGTAKISLFCLGYLVGFFFFLWFGMTLLTKPLRKVVRLWGFLLGYTFFVILSKSCLQLVGCVYLSRVANSYCWVIQLLGLACLRAGNYVFVQEEKALASCSQSEDDAGLTYDAICFVFLLLQLRIYQSHYFRHVVLDLEVQKSLASRGAELINTRLIAQVAEQKNRERNTLQQIKRKMEKIRLRQERLQHKAFTETQDHYIVIRGGDHYMFEEEDEEETESNLDMPDDSSDEELAGPLEILNAAMTGGTKGALQVVERQRSFSDTDLPHSPSPSSCKEKKQSLKPIPEQSEADGTDSKDHSVSGKARQSCSAASEEDEEEKSKDSCHVRCVNGLKVTWAFIGSILDSMISVLFKISNEYRSVSLILDQEREEEKRRRRMARGEILPPLPGAAEITEPKPGPSDREQDPDKAPTRSDVAIKIDGDDGDTVSTRLVPKKSVIDLAELAESEQEFRRRMPRILQLLIALVEATMSRSELLCYFAMVLNTLVNASLLSIPYPISVFLWAMLSVPRPSKTYWITIMTYTEAVVVVKYLFQFGFFPWNDGTVENSPFWPPRILGIEKKDGYAAFDLVLLFCLFIHRSILNRHGLWKDAVDIDADFALAEDKIASSTQTPADSPVKDAPEDVTFGDDQSIIIHNKDLGQENVMFESSTGTSPAESEEKLDGRHKTASDGNKERKGCFSCCKPIRDFYQQMTNARYNAVTDVYAMMFFCDFINFLIIVFGYWAFGPVESTGAAGDEVVTRVIKNNRVPIPFLAMLVVQFVLIIIDRALYLRKNIFGKFMFQICLVILVHVWMFFILPAVTNRAFSENVPAQLWYFIKCIYFGLSAYQIRSGYPTRILGNFLAKRYNYINLFLFKGFLLIPFLLELRALMDWMWTDTTLALSCWLKMEDIYANIFELKCWRWAERRYPTPRGVPRRKVIKYGVGGFLLFLLIFVIWFPLLLFSLASAVFKPNPPVDCTIEMKFGSFQPIFKMSAQQLQLQPVTENSYIELKDQFNKNPSGTAFLASYQPSDVYMAKIDGISTSIWGISPPSEETLMKELLDDRIDINLFTSISFTREPKSGMTSDTVGTQFVQVLKPSDPGVMNIREDLARMINRSYHDVNHFVEIKGVFPQFIQVPVNGKPTPAVPLLGSDQNLWSNISYSKGGDADVTWWILQDVLPDNVFQGTGEKRPQKSLTIISFNERVAPGALAVLTNYGILGLYLSFILVIGRFIRVQTSGLTRDVMFNFLPYVDHIWALVKDIYLVREAGEYRLEEELFAKLMFLYRSPETLIDYTRYPPEKLKTD